MTVQSKPDRVEAEIFTDLPTTMPVHALSWLRSRFNDRAEQAQALADIRYDESRDALALPTWIDGELLAVKYRYIGSDPSQLRYTALSGSKSGLYTLQGGLKDKLLIVEGQFDAISALLGGFQGTVWALESTSLRSSRIDEARAFKHVFLCLDNDDPGQAGANQLYNDFRGAAQIIRIPEPFKDLNELLQARGLDAVRDFLRANTQTSDERSTTSLLERLEGIVKLSTDREQVDGISMGWEALDSCFKLRRGDFLVVNSFAKSGKSTFVTNLAYNLVKAGHVTALSSFEMTLEEDLFPLILSLEAGLDVLDHGEQAIIEAAESFAPHNDKLKVWDKLGHSDVDSLERWVTSLDDKPFALIIDHAGFLLTRSGDPSETQLLASKLFTMAKRHNMAVILVVQAPKPMQNIKDGARLRMLDEYSGMGGSAWAQHSTAYVTISRDPEHKNVNWIRLVTSRNRRNFAGHDPIALYYNRGSGKLTDSPCD